MRLSRLLLIACLIIVYASCKKDSSITFTPSLYFLNGDTTNKSLILFPSEDSVTINAIISSTYLLSTTAHIQIGVDNNALSSYNSYHSTGFELMPANAYSFKDTSTIYSSTSSRPSIYDTVIITIYKNQLDLTKAYMLPISIVNADGVALTAGSSTIYLHTVTNKLAGLYNATGVKISYNGDAADSSVNSIDSFSIAKSLVPQDTVHSSLDYADLGSNGWEYILSFSSDIDNPDNPPVFTVGTNDVLQSSIQAGSFSILSSSYNSATKSIHIKSTYKNTSGNQRIVDETLTLQ